MSLRVALCFLFVLGFSIYAWRNWFVSLCALILLMAGVQHPDMPRNIAGIQGLNPWNILLANVVIAWWRNRRSEGLEWDMPPLLNLLLLGYGLMVLMAAIRLLLNSGPDAAEFTAGYVISEKIVNCLKYAMPGLLLYDACRNRRRIQLALGVTMLLYVLLAIQVIRWVPFEALSGGADLNRIGYRYIQKEIGYNRVTMSMMLGGASWAMLALLGLARSRREKVVVLLASLGVMLAQALTGGRTGYVSWLAVGLVIAVVRWRKLLLFLPVALLVIMLFMPGVRDRMFQGFGGNAGRTVVQRDDYEITAGRNLAWPLVIDKIQDSPLVGYGREGMSTTGIKARLMEDGEDFGHPHNAYLEVLLDSGFVGFCCELPFFLVVLWRSFQLFRDKLDPLVSAVGGAAFALQLALLVGSMGGQTFYPREGAVGMWAAIGIMLRVSVERARSVATGTPLFEEQEDDAEVTQEFPEDSPPQPA